QTGGRRFCRTSCAVGSWGATSGARRAASTTADTRIPPTAADLWRHGAPAAGRRGVSGSALARRWSARVREANAWIKVGVQQVDDQVEQDVHDAYDEDERLHDREVALTDSLERQPPHARIAEHLLDDDGVAKETGEL